MKILNIYPAEATNPETGEVVEKIRVRYEVNGLPNEVFVLNSLEELQAAGSTIQEVGNKLLFKEGQYGLYARLPRVRATSNSIFDTEEVEA